MGPRAGTFAISAFMLQRDAARDGEKIPTVFFALCTWYHLCASCHGLRSLIGEEYGAQGWYFRHCGSQTNGSYLFKTIERGKTDAFSEISVVRWGGAPAERASHSKEKVTRVLSVRIENFTLDDGFPFPPSDGRTCHARGQAVQHSPTGQGGI